MTVWMTEKEGGPKMGTGEKSEYHRGSKTNPKMDYIADWGLIFAFA
jgi:hypothetical protein